MANKAWLEDEYVKAWFARIGERTAQNYSEVFKEWLDYICMSPTEQILKRAKDLTSINPLEQRFFETKAIEYKRHLQDKYGSEYKIKQRLVAMASFFSRNMYPIVVKGLTTNIEVKEKIEKPKFKIDNADVRKMYGLANPRDRALLLVLYHSGLSEIDVSSLNIEHLKGATEDQHFYIEGKREKTNQEFATCISCETIHDIQIMLMERDNPPETEPLFIDKNGKRLDSRYMNEAIKGLAEKVFTVEKAKMFKTRMLRSLYNSALLRAKIQPQELKDLLMGHARKGARKHYGFDEQTIRDAYIEAFEHLSINHGTQEKIALNEIKQELANNRKGLEELALMLKEERQKRHELEDQQTLILQKIAEVDNELLDTIKLELENANKPITARLAKIETMLNIKEE